MKKIFIVHGDKGGVGKTEVAKRTAAAIISREKPITLIDGDNKNPGLHAAFCNDRTELQCINVMQSHGLESLINLIVESPNDVLIDLPARGTDVTEKLTRDGADEDAFNIFELLSEIEAEIVVIFVIDQSRAPLVVLRDELVTLSHGVKWIVVRNHREDRNFSLFENSKVKANLLEKGVPIIDLIRLDPRVCDILENNGLNLLSAQSSEKLSAIQKMRVKAALRKWGEQLEFAGVI